MILNDLSDYYQQLLEEHPNEVARPGWGKCAVAASLVLDRQGKLVSVVPAEGKHGDEMLVPEQKKRSSGVAANFLCDTGSYLLGRDQKGKPERAIRCFEASKDLHETILANAHGEAAAAIKAFFSTWDPSKADENVAFVQHEDVLTSGRFLTFFLEDDGLLHPAAKDPEVRGAWDKSYSAPSDADVQMRDLVSGELKPIARLHPSIKGVAGAQSSGASLISFNDQSSESYGYDKQQGLNAPVAKDVAQAYVAALSYLLSSSEHRARMGDTTVVYWSKKCDSGNSALFSRTVLGNIGAGLNASQRKDEQLKLDAAITAMVNGQHRSTSEEDFDAPFHVLGLAPNASRLAVRFYLSNTFGEFMSNVERHYRRSFVPGSPRQRKFIPPFALLRAVENPNSKQAPYSSTLCAPLMRAILNGDRYPEGLYESAILRIRTSQNDDDKHTRKVSRGCVSIIRAYLIRNKGKSEEEVTVELNEEKTNTAYNLGRLFAVLEDVQHRANGSTNLANRYMDSASTTPAIVFPTLLRLANAHLTKIGHDAGGLSHHFKKQIAHLLEAERVPSFPARLSLEDQGEFFLGYYQQYVSGFKKNDTSDEKTEGQEN